MDALTACYWFSGECGVSVSGLTLAELFTMSCGRRQLARMTTLWQSTVLLNDKLDAEAFVRTGFAGTTGKLTMSPKLRRKVDKEIARMNKERGE